MYSVTQTCKKELSLPMLDLLVETAGDFYGILDTIRTTTSNTVFHSVWAPNVAATSPSWGAIQAANKKHQDPCLLPNCHLLTKLFKGSKCPDSSKLISGTKDLKKKYRHIDSKHPMDVLKDWTSAIVPLPLPASAVPSNHNGSLSSPAFCAASVMLQRDFFHTFHQILSYSFLKWR